MPTIAALVAAYWLRPGAPPPVRTPDQDDPTSARQLTNKMVRKYFGGPDVKLPHRLTLLRHQCAQRVHAHEACSMNQRGDTGHWTQRRFERVYIGHIKGHGREVRRALRGRRQVDTGHAPAIIDQPADDQLAIRNWPQSPPRVWEWSRDAPGDHGLLRSLQWTTRRSMLRTPP